MARQLVNQNFHSVKYKYFELDGPPHNPGWRCEVLVEGRKWEGFGRTKDVAGNEAAQAVVDALDPVSTGLVSEADHDFGVGGLSISRDLGSEQSRSEGGDGSQSLLNGLEGGLISESGTTTLPQALLRGPSAPGSHVGTTDDDQAITMRSFQQNISALEWRVQNLEGRNVCTSCVTFEDRISKLEALLSSRVDASVSEK